MRYEVRILFLFLIFIPGKSVFAQEYPLIQYTSTLKDPVFRQQQKETEAWYYNQARMQPSPPLTMYEYQSLSSDSLIQLAATFNLPVDTLATINNLQNIHDFEPGMHLLIPSSPGLFIPQEKDSQWFLNLKNSGFDREYMELNLPYKGGNVSFRYYPGEYIPREFRTRFVQPLFIPPLKDLYITSPYGYRDHPFTGKWELHVGTDFRAAMGTQVQSCSSGNILSIGRLEDYGKYIIIEHRNGYTSLYGHLNKILVQKGQMVQEGQIIGESGNTGYSTGPHLHFEIRKNGLPQNPENLLTKSGK